MSSNLQKKLIEVSKICIYGIIVQLSVYTLAFAIGSKAQMKSVNEIEVELSFESPTKLKNVLKEIERSTDFYFSYIDGDFSRVKVAIEPENSSLGDVLRSISQQSELSFKRINEAIYIKKGLANEPLVHEILDPEQLNVSGKVIDEGGDPLPGATILEKGTTNGTTTDISGSFSLNVSRNATLTISFVGYETQEIPVNNRSVIDIELVEDSEQLEEVVVVGYGAQKKSDVTGALASVSPEDFEKQPIVRFDQALQGRAPGVQVTQTSGALDGGYKIRIRGANSIDGNNRPLYIVDGFFSSNTSDINVNDIESIEILKDASATAIYGSRGANGVVLITTKSGKRGDSKITFNTFHGISNVVRKVDLMTPAQFAEGVNYSEGVERFTPAEIDELRNVGGQNWQDNILQEAPSSNYQLAFQGGGQKVDFYISGNYFKTEGIVINQDYERYQLRANINADISDKIKIGLNAMGSSSTQTGASASIWSALTFDMTTDPYDENGEYNLRSVKSDIGNSQFNPILIPNEAIRESQNAGARANGFFDLELIKNLHLNISGGVDWGTGTNNSYNPILITTIGTASVLNTKSVDIQNTNRLTYVLEKDVHRFQVDAVHEYFYNKSTRLETNASGFISDNTTYKNLEIAETQRISNRLTDAALQSFLGRVNYSLFDKYLLTASVRADGSSKFREGNRWGIFPSGSVAWRVSEEGFLADNKIIDNLKLRLSYGVTGSQAINALATRSQPVLGVDVNYPLTGGSYFVGIAPSNRAANENLTWEETAQWNGGIDLGLWGSRVTLTIDAYKKHTYNLLLDRVFPEFVGPTIRAENIGEVDNSGIEFILGLVAVDNDNLTITTDFTFSRNVNEVVALVDDQEFLIKGDPYDNGIEVNPTRVEVGKPISTFRGYVFDGVYQLGEETDAAVYGRVPGDAKYRDINEDGAITTDDIVSIGDGNPDFTYGWNTTVNWKNFDLNLFFIGSQGNDIYNLLRARMMGIGVSAYHASHADYNNRWSSENPSSIPATRDRTFMASTQFLENGSYFSLKNVSLGYTIDQIEGIKIRVYSNIQNAFILTKYTGYDPETTSSGASDVDLGIDYGAYPLARTVNFGVSLTF